MPEAPNLIYAMGLAPVKAIEYFEAKGYTISWNWYDTWQEANAKAFTVAKAARLDVLQDIRAAVSKALVQGQTLKQFQDNLEPLLTKKGWWGRQEVAGPNGKELVQLGSPRRLATIYRTNLQTAYMAGRYQGMVANAERRPYWQYIAVNDSRTRPDHAAMHGRVFRWDDPIWQSLYPPNGWGCRCRVRALTARQVERGKLRVEFGAGKLRTEQKLVSQKTGELQPVTAYSYGSDGRNKLWFTPDVGWSYNPGMAHWHPALNRYPYATAKRYVEGTMTGPPFDHFYRRTQALVEKVNAQHPSATKNELRKLIRPYLSNEAFPVAVISRDMAKALGTNTQAVLLSQDTLAKQIINRENQPIDRVTYQMLQANIESASPVVQKDELNQLYFYDDKGRLHRAVIKRTRDGRELYLQSVHLSNEKTKRKNVKEGAVVRE